MIRRAVPSFESAFRLCSGATEVGEGLWSSLYVTWQLLFSSFLFFFNQWQVKRWWHWRQNPTISWLLRFRTCPIYPAHLYRPIFLVLYLVTTTSVGYQVISSSLSTASKEFLTTSVKHVLMDNPLIAHSEVRWGVLSSLRWVFFLKLLLSVVLYFTSLFQIRATRCNSPVHRQASNPLTPRLWLQCSSFFSPLASCWTHILSSRGC